MRVPWRRLLLIAAILIAAVGAIAPFQQANRFKQRIQAGIETSLGRKVELGEVHYNLFTGPGFTVNDVTIAEDGAAGIEPFIYVARLDARVRLASLFSNHLEFSNLRLTEPTVNLVKTASGAWNFQLLEKYMEARALAPLGPDAARRRVPAVEVRSGRINFKFEDRKAEFYFSDTDLDISASDGGRIEMRFEGAPSRTDREAQSFGRLSGRGYWLRLPDQESRLELNVAMLRSPLVDVARLLAGRDLGVHGNVSLQARLSGPMSDLRMLGQLKLEDIHRWDLMPNGGTLDLAWKGTLNAAAQTLELETLAADHPKLPVSVRLGASNYLAAPAWTLSAEFRDMPAMLLVEAARRFGANIPEKFKLDGSAEGAVDLKGDSGLEGQVSLHESTIELPDASPLHVARADAVFKHHELTLEKSTVAMPGDQSAEVEGRYAFDSQAFEVRVSTRGMKIVDFRAGPARLLGASALPLLMICHDGTWRGWVAFGREESKPGEWSGQFDVQNAQVDIPGLSERAHLSSASVALDAAKVAVTRMRGKAGGIAFEGDYNYDESSPRAHRIRLTLDRVRFEQMEAALQPAMRRTPEGFLARAFRLGRVAAPEWLKDRKLEGTLRVNALDTGDRDWKIANARLQWDGTNIRLTRVAAESGDMQATGSVTADLSAALPVYRFSGRVQNLEFKGGRLDVEGNVEAAGTGYLLARSLQGAGSFQGTSITFAPDAEFRTISGAFEVARGANAGLRVTGLSASIGPETYLGQGATQPDGRLSLDLTAGRKQIRYMGSLFTPADSGQRP